MLRTFLIQDWKESFSSINQEKALYSLENGQILYFPQLTFPLSNDETCFLSEDYADPKSKNISFHPLQDKLWGVQRLSDKQHIQLRMMLERFYHHAYELIKNLLPHYVPHLITARTSFRPIEVSHRKTSYRKDDKRLHIDAFPSAPNQGKRILRVFCNINPHGEDRIWRIGEPFDQVTKRFLHRMKKPLLGKAALLRLLKITKSYRSLYDHYMLCIHNAMKADEAYQKEVSQHEIRFPSGSTWIVQTDHVSHAAMQGRHVLEQTFYLPTHAMQNEALSPLHILQQSLGQKLI